MSSDDTTTSNRYGWMTVTALMRQSATIHSGRTAVITEDRTLTFAEAWNRGVRLANAMRALGVQSGDRVAGLEDNNIGAADMLLGCAIAGAVRVPLYPRNSREAHRAMLEDTGCTVVITDTAHAEGVNGLETELETLQHVVVRDEGYEDWLRSQDDTDPELPIDGDDWYVIRHSAGTTGKPKGVAYTHHDWVLNCRNWATLLERLSTTSVFGHVAPISHASGYLFLPTWLVGGANLLFGTTDPAKVLQMMRRHRVTHMFTPPSLLGALARQPDATAQEWTNLRSVLVGGAPITDDTALLAHEVFGDTLVQAFGQTEAVPITQMDSAEWFGEFEGSTPLRSAGRVVPYAQAKIIGPDGDELPVGEEGEIVARVEGQMRGYWGDDELTKARLVDGWVHTNDIGRFDTNGFLYVLDRADDMIISGGYNIWPAELETVIADHPDVIEVAVFGIPDEHWGETPMAVVTVIDSATVTGQELIAACSTRLGSYKKPSRIEFTTEPLPKSVVGKLQRKALREPHWAGHDRRISGS